ncbi:MAG: TRAP transporter large permease [Rhodobacteraceae bacterium]|nr:TRAP transporter large permease [Paracoccaceae bacterium]
MTAISVALLGFGLLMFFLLLGLPVAFSILMAGVAGIWLTVGSGPIAGVLAHTPYEHVASYTLSSVPLFILMAELLSAGRFTSDLFNISHRFLGHLKGGISYATVAGGVLLAAMSGSSTAAASTLASVAFPEMRRYNYDPRFSAALLSIVGTLAIMIPPSIGLILYGVFTETSVGRLLLAGLIPGALTALGFAVTIFILVRRNPDYAPQTATRATARERWQSIATAWPVILLLAGMVFALYSGIITATEVGAVGAFAALVIGIMMGRVGVSGVWAAAVRATRASAMILTIVGFSAVIGVFMALNGTTNLLLNIIAESGLPNWAVLGLVLLLLLVLGFFLDQLAILILTLPVVFPLMTQLGYDPVWLGVIFVKTAEIGLITPPMGMNVFVVAGVTRMPVTEVFKGIWPFVVTELVILVLLVLLPQLALWFPRVMYG